MTTMKMKKYGIVLTGREFGADVMNQLSDELKYPVTLDFEGVASMGSSFGDEIVPKIAANQGNKIEVCNVKKPIADCLNTIAKDYGIEIIYIDQVLTHKAELAQAPSAISKQTYYF